ncbi:peptidase M20 [Pseudoduganella namucuonensis]|uniref:Acetylornithine deacetylase/Succinyl-diaminopimelate desuccinylase n=1 Tax=Pseudoduganella namucuonensis TaxID=1035707 RepID=A0A1I7IM85_9BURK|nr:peptidase M20 [Pseudoduganella namucuonensis]SFU74035.1 Acetylornithine deacetylase/Succinyl-diaminopimelate desuccinylase [Pseudoduganella namucuonensis]
MASNFNAHQQPASQLYRISAEEKAQIDAAIDSEELTDLALELGNIPSRSGEEGAAARYVFDWMRREGFKPRAVGATPERPNIIGEYGGRGNAANLLFTAHLDTESPAFSAQLDDYKYRPETVQQKEWTRCWLQDNRLHGYPIANDRGPMSCFLIAAKALRKTGIELAGRLYLTACPGEIGPEPIEEYQGIGYLGKDIGAHYLFHHGGIAADYAIAAEGTDYGITWKGCGYVLFRIRLLGQSTFTPALAHHADLASHPNPIYRIGRLIEALHGWAGDYEVRYRDESEGGISIPKVQIDAIRGGVPHTFGSGSEICGLYLEVGLTARQTVAPVLRELQTLLGSLDLGEFDISPLVVRHGYEADRDAVAPLVAAIGSATEGVLGHALKRADPIYSSMWRDHNVFNMQRIPAVTCGIPRVLPTPDDLVRSAKIYALTALAICGRA